MSKPNPSVVELQSERSRTLFEIEELEREIRVISDQLDDARDTEKENTDWWHRARDAKRHKERQRRVLMARADRLTRNLNRISPDAKKAEAKETLREVMRTLFTVARTALAFYEDETEENETAFTNALDRLDQVIPGWDGPQERKPPTLQKVEMG